jgi:hypothetical protein
MSLSVAAWPQSSLRRQSQTRAMARSNRGSDAAPSAAASMVSRRQNAWAPVAAFDGQRDYNADCLGCGAHATASVGRGASMSRMIDPRPPVRRSTAIPSPVMVTRSTRRRTMRACSAGNSDDHSASRGVVPIKAAALFRRGRRHRRAGGAEDQSLQQGWRLAPGAGRP